MNIDWDRVHGVQVRAPKAPTFTQDQIDAAVQEAQTLAAAGDDPNVLASFWPMPANMPDLGDLDFHDVTVGDLALSGDRTCASNKKLKRDDLIWHIQHPGQRKNPNPLTTHPLVLVRKNTDVIIDGQHTLAALMLLGVTSWPCWLIQK